MKQTGQVAQEREVDLDSLIDHRFAELRRDITSVGLYRKPELIQALYKQIAAAGVAKGQQPYTAFLPFDQHHYHGTDAIDEVVQKIGITSTSRVINIGSGLGGPARYLAGKLGCQVLAVELQPDLHRTFFNLLLS